jgi:hypothetical protein
VNKCARCGQPFEAKRSTAKFCGGKCRALAAKERSRGVVVTPIEAPAADASGLVYGATRSELEAADRLSTSLGAKALALAARIDSGQDTGSALAALVKQHDATMAEAVKGAQVAASPLDELRRRRDAKRAAG